MLENKTKLGQEPAFQVPTNCRLKLDSNDNVINSPEDGMSKRFYAATFALQGLCANQKNTKMGSNLFIRILQLFFPKINIKSTTGNCKDMVAIAYDMADELLRQE